MVHFWFRSLEVEFEVEFGFEFGFEFGLSSGWGLFERVFKVKLSSVELLSLKLASESVLSVF